ncbi:MAG: octaprenyl diphosphate synthase [Candidatus Sumerlaeia bacterium]
MIAAKSYLERDIEQVEREIEATLDSASATIQNVAAYLQINGGKKLRPILAMLTARMFGHHGPEQIYIAAALELIHTATLLHDDIIDNAATRRGRPTVNAKFGQDVAILMADYLYASAFDLALTALNPEVLKVLTQATRKMVEGEMFQIERRGRRLTEADYLLIIEAKTAYLFAAAATLGAVVAGASKNDIFEMGNFGLHFGIAFQITDDALDYVGDSAVWGKPLGNDFLEGKQTLPLIRAMDCATPDERSAIWEGFTNGTNLDAAMQIMRRYNTIDYSLDRARLFTEKALASLRRVGPESEPRRLIEDLTHYIVTRSY